MGKLPMIDADSHIEECEATWSYLEAPYSDRRPIHLTLGGTPGLPRNDSYWLIDGRIHARPGMPGSTMSGSPVSSTLARSKPFTAESQTLEDVGQRLADQRGDGARVRGIVAGGAERAVSDVAEEAPELHRQRLVEDHAAPERRLVGARPSEELVHLRFKAQLLQGNPCRLFRHRHFVPAQQALEGQPGAAEGSGDQAGQIVCCAVARTDEEKPLVLSHQIEDHRRQLSAPHRQVVAPVRGQHRCAGGRSHRPALS